MLFKKQVFPRFLRRLGTRDSVSVGAEEEEAFIESRGSFREAGVEASEIGETVGVAATELDGEEELEEL